MFFFSVHKINQNLSLFGQNIMFLSLRETCTRDNVMLECSKRAENIINRKVSIFYIETVLNFFFNSEKKI